jgi:hypothetical protein
MSTSTFGKILEHFKGPQIHQLIGGYLFSASFEKEGEQWPVHDD